MAVITPPLRPDDIDVERLDIIGHSERGHLSHVGFAWEHGQFSRDNEVMIVDARPLRRSNEKLAVHVIGRLSLSARERMLMTTWLERWQRARTLAGDFIVFDDVLRDAITSRVIGRRMSGAGMVDACVRTCLGIELVVREALPNVELERLQLIFGERAVQMAAYRGELAGSGPWTVLLPAYLLHALARPQPRAASLRASAEQWDFKA